MLIGAGAIFAYFQFKPTEQKPTSPPQSNPATPTTTPNPISGWKTFNGKIAEWQNNNEYKFQFQTPQEFKEIIPYPYANPKYYYGVEGNRITFFSGPMEGPSLKTTLYAYGNQNPLCSNALNIQENYYDSSQVVFEACDIIKIDGRDALFLIRMALTGFETSACQPEAAVYIIHNFGINGSFLFTTELDVLDEITSLWPNIPLNYSRLDDKGTEWFCPPDIDHSKVKEQFDANITNIRNAENLSESDIYRLKTLYQILSTFQFTN